MKTALVALEMCILEAGQLLKWERMKMIMGGMEQDPRGAVVRQVVMEFLVL
jgi:hypothetical protein